MTPGFFTPLTLQTKQAMTTIIAEDTISQDSDLQCDVGEGRRALSQGLNQKLEQEKEQLLQQRSEIMSEVAKVLACVLEQKGA